MAKLFSQDHVAQHVRNTVDQEDYDGGDAEAHEGVISRHVSPHKNWELKKIPVNKLHGYHGTHFANDAQIKDKVDRYSSMKGSVPPGVAVPHSKKSGHFDLVDGKHRHMNAIAEGQTHMEVYVPSTGSSVAKKPLKKSEDQSGIIFVSCDGDAIGQKVGRASLSDDMEGLQAIEAQIEAGNEVVLQFAESRGGSVITCGGDEVNFSVPADALGDLDALRKDYEFHSGSTLTVGVGSKLSEANKALHVAKIRGKNQTLMFSPEVDQEWAKAQQDANDGTASGEAKKLGEAYMTIKEQPKDDCPACKEFDAKNDVKHDDDCPMCKEYDGAQSADSMSDDCPACKEYDEKAAHNDDCPMCQEMDEDADQSDQAEVDAATAGNEMDDCPDCQALLEGASDGEAQDPAEQGMETKDEIMQQLDDAPEVGNPTPQDLAQSIDDTDLPQGQATDGNASVPENYGDAQEASESQQPGQEGQDPTDQDGSPDMVQVLRDGLNDSEDEIKRQKVVDMVSRALMSFKNQKDVLEQAKAQFPDFYVANIQMLRCMIELCKLLGLEPKREQAEYESPDQPAASAQSPAAPQEGAAQAPQQ